LEERAIGAWSDLVSVPAHAVGLADALTLRSDRLQHLMGLRCAPHSSLEILPFILARRLRRLLGGQ